jgi:hypothetical protein
MKLGLARGAVFLGAALGVSTAFAAAGDTSASVSPMSENVTYSSAATAKAKALTSYIGYTATVTNNAATNTINNIIFEGTLTIAGDGLVLAQGGELSLSSWEGISTCTSVPVSSYQVTVRCAVGQLKAGVSTPTFALFFKAPIPATARTPGADKVSFVGTIITAEGPNLSDPTPDSVDAWGPAVQVSMGTTNINNVKSAVPKGGTLLFTGTGGISLVDDPFTTTVTVPELAAFTTAEILEDALTCTSGKFLTCNTSKLTIPGTFPNSPYLTIILRQDATNIVRGTKIDTVVIKYTPDPTVEVLTPATIPVPDCIGGAPAGGDIPCILKRIYYRNKGVQGWTADLDGDFEWQIINTKNGRFGIE